MLKRRVGNPNIHSVLEYSSNGCRPFAGQGGPSTTDAAHGLRRHCSCQVDAYRLRPPTLDLSVLRLGFDVRRRRWTGSSAAVKSLSLLSREPVEDRLHGHGLEPPPVRDDCWKEKCRARGGELALHRRAHQLYYPPEPGKARAKVVTIEVTRKGR